MSVSKHRREVLEGRALVFRHNPTPSEAVLWAAIRGKRVCGAQFRRQVVLLGEFIVDFYASSRRLVVEVDGGYHSRRVCADARRDRLLVRGGYSVLRLQEEEVMHRLPAALQRVRAALE